jgi:hypothetical protein
LSFDHHAVSNEVVGPLAEVGGATWIWQKVHCDRRKEIIPKTSMQTPESLIVSSGFGAHESLSTLGLGKAILLFVQEVALCRLSRVCEIN